MPQRAALARAPRVHARDVGDSIVASLSDDHDRRVELPARDERHGGVFLEYSVFGILADCFRERHARGRLLDRSRDVRTPDGAEDVQRAVHRREERVPRAAGDVRDGSQVRTAGDARGRPPRQSTSVRRRAAAGARTRELPLDVQRELVPEADSPQLASVRVPPRVHLSVCDGGGVPPAAGHGRDALPRERLDARRRRARVFAKPKFRRRRFFFFLLRGDRLDAQRAERVLAPGEQRAVRGERGDVAPARRDERHFPVAGEPYRRGGPARGRVRTSPEDAGAPPLGVSPREAPPVAAHGERHRTAAAHTHVPVRARTGGAKP